MTRENIFGKCQRFRWPSDFRFVLYYAVNEFMPILVHNIFYNPGRSHIRVLQYTHQNILQISSHLQCAIVNFNVLFMP